MPRPAISLAGALALGLTACGAEPAPPPPDPADNSEKRALEKADAMLDEERARDTTAEEPVR